MSDSNGMQLLELSINFKLYYYFYVLLQSLYLLPLLLAGAVTLLTIAFTCWCNHFNFAGDPEKDVLQT